MKKREKFLVIAHFCLTILSLAAFCYIIFFSFTLVDLSKNGEGAEKGIGLPVLLMIYVILGIICLVCEILSTLCALGLRRLEDEKKAKVYKWFFIGGLILLLLTIATTIITLILI